MPTQRNSFKQVQYIVGDDLLMNKLETNLKTWFDWALLRSGGWSDVLIPSYGPYDGDYSILREVSDPSFTARTVYESARKDWVWETGVDHVDTTSSTVNPISPASVFVNGAPVVPDHINYPLGRVVFSTPRAVSDVVTATYSYRYAQVYRADDVPWWQELQYRSLRVDDSHFSQLSKGVWAVGSQHRVQMPCVIVEAVPRARSSPFQLGDGSAWVEQDVLVHVLSESRSTRNNLVDAFRGQFDTSIWLFDSSLIAAAGDFPLDYQGEIVDSTKTYEALVDPITGHRCESCRISRTEVSEVEAINSRLYEGVVRMTCEVVLDD